MDSNDSVRLCVLIVLIIFSAFFSSSETALTTVNKIRMKNLADSGDKRAKTVLKILQKPDKMLSAILIGNNIVNLYASSLSTVLVTSVFGSRVVGAATGILTLLILVFGEISPKTASTLYADEISLRIAGIIWFFMRFLTPAIVLVNRLAFLVLRILRVDLHRKGDTITEDELRTMVEVSHQEGEIEESEKKMINNVFDFGDAVARDVMVPRVDMTFVRADATYDELMRIFRKEKYTRYPVYEDSSDDVTGILNIKDILLRGQDDNFNVRDYLRKPFFTFEMKRVSDLMVDMRKGNVNIVIVIDEYGVTAGLITLEDMLEEIVGEIHDEYDDDEDNNFRQVNSREYVVEGSMNLGDIDERLGISLESEDYDSIGGLMIGLLDHLPAQGETVIIDRIRLTAQRVRGNRIDKVRITLPENGAPMEKRQNSGRPAEN
ncbi:HlyC/CorC family transporter [Clostridium vitabionis]|uniref:HlyC/CorC family transporter n=1 Tax=Clostridium vitabionis TaxID=2784388 RepID=UPI00188AC54D|nr:hemolysin family protein [Clostridium vitabionis]